MAYDTLTGVLGLLEGGEQRFREKIVAAADLQRGDKVLDVGCGTGTLTVLMSLSVGEEGEIVGSDLSQRMLAAARRKAKRPNLIFRDANAEAILYPEGYFDVVTRPTCSMRCNGAHERTPCVRFAAFSGRMDASLL